MQKRLISATVSLIPAIMLFGPLVFLAVYTFRTAPKAPIVADSGNPSPYTLAQNIFF